MKAVCHTLMGVGVRAKEAPVTATVRTIREANAAIGRALTGAQTGRAAWSI